MPASLPQPLATLDRRGQLDIVEVPAASAQSADLFRRVFRAEIPDFPRHFEIVATGRDNPGARLGYVHYSSFDTAWLAGGLVVAAMEFRRLDSQTADLVREAGGLAEWLMSESCRYLGGDAVFAYMGDRKSITVNTRVGFRPTGHQYLYVILRDTVPDERASAIIEKVRQIGPF